MTTPSITTNPEPSPATPAPGKDSIIEAVLAVIDQVPHGYTNQQAMEFLALEIPVVIDGLFDKPKE